MFHSSRVKVKEFSYIVPRTVDQVDDTMDEIREQMEVANEISDAISQPLGGELFDDDELEQELAELEEESINEQFIKAPVQAAAKATGSKSSLDAIKCWYFFFLNSHFSL